MCSWTQWNVKCKQLSDFCKKGGKYTIDYGNDDENENDDDGDKGPSIYYVIQIWGPGRPLPPIVIL